MTYNKMTKEEWNAHRLPLTVQLTLCTPEEIESMSAKQIVLAIMGEDEADWTLDRASLYEQEIGQTHGEAKLNDEFRMHDEAGITISQVDAENEFDLNKDLLIKYRAFMRASTVDKDLKAEMVRRFQGFRFSVQQYINGLDNKYSSKKFEEMESDRPEKDYNKTHWNLAEKHWDNVIIKVRSMMRCRKNTYKNQGMFRKMYARLCDYRKRREINYRQFAELRYMLSAHMWELTDDMYWAERADVDQINLQKATGKKNVLGENVPDNTQYISMDEISRPDEASLVGTTRISEDEMIDGIYLLQKFERTMECYNGILDGFLHDDVEEMKERWYDRNIINKMLPTGADNVDVATAVIAFYRCDGSRKEAAALLQISRTTLCRRLNDAKEMLAANETVHPVMKEAMAASL